MKQGSSNFAALLNRRLSRDAAIGVCLRSPARAHLRDLQAWLTVEGVDLKTIGIFTLVGLPYTLKFLWAPVMDRVVPPWLGRRRGWMVLTQLCVAVGLGTHGPDQSKASPRMARGLCRTGRIFGRVAWILSSTPIEQTRSIPMSADWARQYG